MAKVKLYYATNRKHRGRDRWRPSGYGTEFSSDGMENLRFGKVDVEVDRDKIRRYLRRDTGFGTGSGEALTKYLTGRARSRQATTIRAFKESLVATRSDQNQPSDAKYGSKAMFAELRELMMKCRDVVVYVHGFNVSWVDAVGSALALQEMLNLATPSGEPEIVVVMFTWPSNGQALPFVSYKSDRADAAASGGALGRALLKLRDFLSKLVAPPGSGDDDEACGRELHLLCHSMGNYVLQSALHRLAAFTAGRAMPRIFQHVFLCAADVDDEVLELEGPMGRLHEIGRSVTVYHNRGDVALHVSDYTKGNPDRLGTSGAARPVAVHSKIHQVDCSKVVTGLVEHSYYLCGNANLDIRQSLVGAAQEDPARPRMSDLRGRNLWTLR